MERLASQALFAGTLAAFGIAAALAQTPPKLDFVIVDNLGHLPMIVGALNTRSQRSSRGA